MSHNINEEKVFVVGEPAWHRVGKVLEKPATAQEAIQAAQLDYPVEKMPVYICPDGMNRIVPRKYATVRKDNNAPLGIVGSQYAIVQNTEAFSFFDSIVGEGQAVYHSAGALGLGERIWILAKLPNDIVVKDDVVEKFLLLVNSHDGSSPLQMFFTPIRVVCQNTLTMAMSDRQNEVRIRHSGNIVNKVSFAREILQVTGKFYGEFEGLINQLANRALTATEAKRYFNLIVFNHETRETDSTQLKNKRDKLLTLFERGVGNEQSRIQHTAWAALNAVTEFVDHHHRIKGVSDEGDGSDRVNNIWFGSGAALKRKALSNIVQVSGIM